MRGRFPPSAGVANFLLPRRLTNGSHSPPPPPLLRQHLALLLQTVQALGFIINWDKSELTPTQCPIFLGATLDIPGSWRGPARGGSPQLWRRPGYFVADGKPRPRHGFSSWAFLSSLVDVLRESTREAYIPVLRDFSTGANLTGWIPVQHL